VGHVFDQDRFQVSPSEHERPVQALSAQRPHHALGVGVRLRRPHRRLDDFHTLGGEHLVEGPGELRVPISDEELSLRQDITGSKEEVAGLLGHPRPGWLGGDPRQVDPSRVELDEEQHVEAAQEHGIYGEEISGQHRLRLARKERLPARPTSGAGRSQSPLCEHSPDRGGRHSNAETLELPLDT
jgi:hypothetical protein